MFKTPLGAALCAAILPVAAWAAPDAANPDAPVPRVAYRSVFTGTPTGVAGEGIDWRKANAEVGRFPRGHVDLLKWEAAQPGAAPATPAAASASAPAAAPASSAAPARHRH